MNPAQFIFNYENLQVKCISNGLQLLPSKKEAIKNIKVNWSGIQIEIQTDTNIFDFDWYHDNLSELFCHRFRCYMLNDLKLLAYGSGISYLLSLASGYLGVVAARTNPCRHYIVLTNEYSVLQDYMWSGMLSMGWKQIIVHDNLICLKMSM